MATKKATKKEREQRTEEVTKALDVIDQFKGLATSIEVKYEYTRQGELPTHIENLYYNAMHTPGVNVVNEYGKLVFRLGPKSELQIAMER